MEKKLSEQIEVIIKVTAVLVGGFFVLGIFVTNIQLMSVGISDFDLIKSRNVIVGAIFLYFLFLFLLAISPIIIVPILLFRLKNEINSNWKPLKKTIFYMVSLIGFGFIIFLLSSLVGTLAGYTLQDGYTWEQGQKSWTSINEMGTGLRLSFMQFKEIYLHRTWIMTIPAFVIGEAFIFNFCKKSMDGTLQNKDRINLIYGYLCLIIALPITIFGYSQYVYPNVRYNIGGGQPRFAEIYIEKTYCDEIDCKKKLNTKDSTVFYLTEPLIIWHQSSDYLFVYPVRLISNESANLYAISKDKISFIKYLTMHAKISDGNKIVKMSSVQ